MTKQELIEAFNSGKHIQCQASLQLVYFRGCLGGVMYYHVSDPDSLSHSSYETVDRLALEAKHFEVYNG